MKKYIFSTILCIISLSVSAYDFCVDDIYYNILPSANTVEVTHDYNAPNSVNGSYKGRVSIPATVIYEGTTYNVTAIGENAFTECDRLSGVTLPESITLIGRKAFYDCLRLKEITLPQSVASIGEFAFYHCTSLQTVNIPASVNSIGSKAFMLCTGLTSLTVDAANAYYCSNNNIIYNKDMTLLVAAMSTYSGHLDIPATVTEIADNAFVECDGLTSINLGNVEIIHDFAFFDCKGLTSVTLPETIKEIRRGAFFNCTKLSSLNMSSNLEVIGERGFMRCLALSDVKFAGKNLIIGNHAFESCKVLNISGIDDCVSEIGDYAFASCIKHRAITLPQSIKRIGCKAFFACYQINRIELGSKIEEIGEKAFLNCSRVRQMTIDATTPPAIHKNTFTDYVYNNTALKVPDESINLYKTAQHWRDFLSIEPSAVTSINNASIKINAIDNHIIITGINNDSIVEVYTTDGKLIQSTNVAHLSQYTFGNGIYIVKVANTACKIAL